MNVTDTAGAITEIQAISASILNTIEAVDPAVGTEAVQADKIVNLLGDLVTKSLAAWSAAAQIPITRDSVLALLPDDTPLVPPKA